MDHFVFNSVNEDIPYMSMTPPLPPPRSDTPFQTLVPDSPARGFPQEYGSQGSEQQLKLVDYLSPYSVPTLPSFLNNPSFGMADSPELMHVELSSTPPRLSHNPSLSGSEGSNNSLTSTDSFSDLIQMSRFNATPNSKIINRTFTCPEPGCGASFGASKHLRRHRMKHKPHRFRCTVPNCTQTSYRSDIMKQHEKSHRRALERSQYVSY